MEAIDEYIYGDKSIHKKIRNSFGGASWDKSPLLYELKFMIRRIRY